jgi:DNA-binding protein YbaB
MKKIIYLFFCLTSYSVSEAQFARMEVKKPIEGVCDQKNVYAVLPMFKNQEEAKCPVSKQEIEKRLNSEVQLLKDSSGYSDKGMVSIIINCKGEVVQCEIDNKTRSAELDKQIVAVFNSLGKWKAGKVSGEKVDTVKLFSFEITDSKITVN